MFTLIVFITSQFILPHLDEGKESEAQRIAVFIRCIYIYLGSMGRFFVNQAKLLASDCKSKSFVSVGCIKVSEYLLDMQNLGSLVLNDYTLPHAYAGTSSHSIAHPSKIQAAKKPTNFVYVCNATLLRAVDWRYYLLYTYLCVHFGVESGLV
jgi:hypothetical protein